MDGSENKREYRVDFNDDSLMRWYQVKRCAALRRALREAKRDLDHIGAAMLPAATRRGLRAISRRIAVVLRVDSAGWSR